MNPRLNLVLGIATLAIVLFAFLAGGKVAGCTMGVCFLAAWLFPLRLSAQQPVPIRVVRGPERYIRRRGDLN
jgi:hypothetical protein